MNKLDPIERVKQSGHDLIMLPDADRPARPREAVFALPLTLTGGDALKSVVGDGALYRQWQAWLAKFNETGISDETTTAPLPVQEAALEALRVNPMFPGWLVVYDTTRPAYLPGDTSILTTAQAIAAGLPGATGYADTPGLHIVVAIEKMLFQGPQGQKGDTGATGGTGPAGQNGTNGRDGKDGKDGKSNDGFKFSFKIDHPETHPPQRTKDSYTDHGSTPQTPNGSTELCGKDLAIIYANVPGGLDGPFGLFAGQFRIMEGNCQSVRAQVDQLASDNFAGYTPSDLVSVTFRFYGIATTNFGLGDLAVRLSDLPFTYLPPAIFVGGCPGGAENDFPAGSDNSSDFTVSENGTDHTVSVEYKFWDWSPLQVGNTSAPLGLADLSLRYRFKSLPTADQILAVLDGRHPSEIYLGVECIEVAKHAAPCDFILGTGTAYSHSFNSSAPGTEECWGGGQIRFDSDNGLFYYGDNGTVHIGRQFFYLADSIEAAGSHTITITASIGDGHDAIDGAVLDVTRGYAELGRQTVSHHASNPTPLTHTWSITFDNSVYVPGDQLGIKIFVASVYSADVDAS